MRVRHRSIDEIVEEQVCQWEARRRARPGRRAATVTVSRLPGAGGRLFAERLAEATGFDLFDREIIQRIAESAHLSERVVATLDERVRSRFAEWMMMLDRERFLSAHQYVHHLTLVLGTIAQHGQAIILGRGSSMVLCHGESLRVLVVAPLDLRVRRIASEEGLEELVAFRHVARVEGERREHLKRCFNAKLADPVCFDLVFNTEHLSITQAVDATQATLHSFVPRLPAPAEELEPASP